MIPITTRTSSSSNIDFSTVKAEAQKKLFKLLDKFEGTKTIVWDDKLIGPFEFVANASLLKQHDASRLFRLSDIKPVVFNEIRTDYTLIFLRKDYNVARYVGEILQRADRVSLAKTSLVFVPYRCASIEKLLEQQHKIDLGKINSIEELNIELFVLDTDVLSTENEFAYRDLYLNSDHSFAHQIAEGLIKIQDIYGQIPRVSGQGRGAKLVCDLLLKHRKLHPSSRTTSQTAQIHQLVLIDRRIDLLTPLLTQLTYEGLLDELFGVNHGTINLPASKFQANEQKDTQQQQQQQPEKPPPPAETKETKRFELRSSEELFAKLRDCHINAVADVLKQSAKNLQAEYEECNSEGKTIPEIGKIVKRLNHLKVAKKSQTNHVTIAELVNEQTLRAEFIFGLRIEHELLQEDKLNRVMPDIDMKLLRQEDGLHVMRLICLHSMVGNGFKQKIGDYYKRELVQNYGPDYLAFMLQLEKANLLLANERFYDVGSFSQLKSKLSLIRDDVDECNPNHLSYVYGGYSPLSIVVTKILSQSASSAMWRSMSDILKVLPEPTINYAPPLAPLNQNFVSTGGVVQAVGGQAANSYLGTSEGSLTNSAIAMASSLLSASSGNPTGLRMRRNSATSSQSSGEETRTVLVFFIGGCTFAEISALRFLSQQEENNCEFLIGTTKIINGTTFLRSLWPHRDKKSEVAVSRW